MVQHYREGIMRFSLHGFVLQPRWLILWSGVFLYGMTLWTGCVSGGECRSVRDCSTNQRCEQGLCVDKQSKNGGQDENVVGEALQEPSPEPGPEASKEVKVGPEPSGGETSKQESSNEENSKDATLENNTAEEPVSESAPNDGGEVVSEPGTELPDKQETTPEKVEPPEFFEKSPEEQERVVEASPEVVTERSGSPFSPLNTKNLIQVIFPGLANSQVNGKLYLVGGMPNGQPSSATNKVQEYDPSKDTWKQCTPIPNTVTAGVFRTGAAGVGNALYVFGGGDKNFAQKNWVLKFVPGSDCSTGTWTDLTSTDPLPASRLDPFAVTVGSKIYIMGSYNSGCCPDRSVWVFDPSASAGSRWTNCGGNSCDSIPYTSSGSTGYQGAVSAVVGSKVHVAGGNWWTSGAGYLYTKAHYVFDPSKAPGSQWKKRAGLPQFMWFFQFQHVKGKLYAIGGVEYISNKNVQTNKIYEYDISQDKWTNCGGSCPSLPIENNYGFSAAIGSDIYIVGGRSNSSSPGPASMALKFTPSP